MGGNNMAKPKMSMWDLFQEYRDCYDYRKDPSIEEQKTTPEARQLMAERFRERKQAAREYANSLIPLGNDWIEDVKRDVKKLTQRLPQSLHFNKAERDAYRDGVEDFLTDVAEALRDYGKEPFLNDKYFDPVTLYRFGIMTYREDLKTGLTKEEATKIYKDFKQRYSKVYCFPDLFSMFPTTYTVLGYKTKVSTPAQAQIKAAGGTNKDVMVSNTVTSQQTQPAKELPDLLNCETFKEILKRGMHEGIISLKDDGSYKWDLPNKKGDPNKLLLAYFAKEVCEILKPKTRLFDNGNHATIWKPFETLCTSLEKVE